MSFRPALLALFIMPAFAQSPADEKGPTTIDAQTIEGVADIEVTARGAAEIRRDDVTIFGEVLRYNRESGQAQGEGGVRLQRGVDRFFGPRLQYNTLDDTGVFESPQYLIQGDLPARGGAERLEFRGTDKYWMRDARYTTCQPGRDDWVLQASELDLDYEAEEGYAKHPRLRFFDTTIVAFPFASFPLNNRRKSGILTPYYAHTTTRGLELGVPYYWNIDPQYDATITPVYMAKRGAQLKNEFRYLDRPYAGELKFEYMPEDREFGRNRYGVTLQHAHTFAPNLVAQVDYNRVSDHRYFIDLASQVRQVSIANLQQDAHITYSGNFAGTVNYSTQLRVHRFQTLQDPLAPITPPYHREPQVTFNASQLDIGGLVDAHVPAEYVRFVHPSLVDGSRLLANPTLTLPAIAPGWFITPKAGVRHVSYGL
ncbi:MAG TPA: LPS assembly protein LptD, partial [Burkholderiales bacterium]|nr:LPS assembly protein LptD [Burkholderiales bacterium]